MKMLRRSMGKTRRDRIWNDTASGMTNVIEVSRKIQKRFGHV